MPAWHHYVAVPAGLLEYKMKLHKNAAVWFYLFKNQNPVSLSPLLVCAFFPSVRDMPLDGCPVLFRLIMNEVS